MASTRQIHRRSATSSACEKAKVSTEQIADADWTVRDICVVSRLCMKQAADSRGDRHDLCCQPTDPRERIA